MLTKLAAKKLAEKQERVSSRHCLTCRHYLGEDRCGLSGDNRPHYLPRGCSKYEETTAKKKRSACSDQPEGTHND